MANDGQETGKFWDASWNVAYGCTPAGEGCKNCWAKANHERWRGDGFTVGTSKRSQVWDRPFDQVQVFPERLEIPLRRKKPTIYSVCFASDPYHEAIPDEMLDRVKAVQALCPQHTFIELTKRWERRAEYANASDVGNRVYRQVGRWLDRDDGDILGGGRRYDEAELLSGWHATGAKYEDCKWTCPLSNVWQGVSISTQAELDAAAPHLLATLAAVKVLSLEPLLEGMTLCARHSPVRGDDGYHHFEGGRRKERCGCLDGIDGIFVGCETGPKRRPCKLGWVVSIVAQCKAAGVPVWVKGVSFDDGVSHKMADWPAAIRVRELPGVAR